MKPGPDHSTKAPVSRARVLWLLVISQFACISLWFAGNSVIQDFVTDFGMKEKDVGHLTTFVQIGFIAGTLLFSLLAIADRYSPSRVFFWSALAAAGCSVMIVFSDGDAWIMYGSRFLTGFFLAGIYPVGMKIAADHFSTDLGKALGFLVGALVVGTAFPHLIRYLQTDLDWKAVMWSTSGLAVAGGWCVRLFIPDGPYRVTGVSLRKEWLAAFKVRTFRSATLGYFGHMWELYAFWTFVPIMVAYVLRDQVERLYDISLLSFLIIGVGGVSCVWGGFLARRYGSRWVARSALAVSGICCAVSPLAMAGPAIWGIIFLFIWSAFVVMDSPQFSALVAGAAPEALKGSALTLVTCIGFSITIVSIQLVTILLPRMGAELSFLLLLPGPVAGMWSMGWMKSTLDRKMIWLWIPIVL